MQLGAAQREGLGKMQTNQKGELRSVASSNEPVQTARSPLSLAITHTFIQDLQALQSLCSLSGYGGLYVVEVNASRCGVEIGAPVSWRRRARRLAGFRRVGTREFLGSTVPSLPVLKKGIFSAIRQL